MRQITIGKRGLADLLGAADAFGDVLPSQLEMYASGIASLGSVDREGAMQLVEDPVEPARLVAVGRRDRVAVHRIDAPHHLTPSALNRADQIRQPRFDLVGAHAGD